ncbi:hypothetical protein C8R41DRAFT_864406 [Lentinula lateritia]|uniref:Uncharacterized protein n=1 Tax=Lentinula lateritia TaxID=40482 RepID=A0ABQ8VR69_9AGAR|nr:hypothetical protein C8R41DRAFT_864406 [Lentinula lateritia]
MSLTGDQFEWLFKWYKGATKNGLLVTLKSNWKESQLMKQKLVRNEKYLTVTPKDTLYLQHGSSPANDAISVSRTYRSAMTNRGSAKISSNREHWQKMVDVDGGYNSDLVKTHGLPTVTADIDDNRSRFNVESTPSYPAVCSGINEENISIMPIGLDFASCNDKIAVNRDEYGLLDFARDLSKLPMMDEDLWSSAVPDKMNSNYDGLPKITNGDADYRGAVENYRV